MCKSLYKAIFSKWSESNGLKLNIGKCTALHVTPRDLIQSLSDNGVGVRFGTDSLTTCDSVETLGVVLDRDITFSGHVTYCIQRALGRLRSLYRFQTLLPEPAKLKLAQVFVLSVFQFCYPAYENRIFREDKGRIQRLQNTVVRFAFNLRLSDHVSPSREDVIMLLMENVCRIMTCSLVHKVLDLKELQYLSVRLSFYREVANRQNRHGGRLHFPRVRLEVGRRAFSYFGPALYNGLPDGIKRYQFSASFRSTMKGLTLRERGLHYSALRLYNALPQGLKDIEKASTVKNQLKALLIEKSLYATNEFLTECTR